MVLTDKQRRVLAESDTSTTDSVATPGSNMSGIAIRSKQATVTLGPSGDIVFQRVSNATSSISGETQFGQIRLESTDDVLIGDCTLTTLLAGTCTAPGKTKCTQTRVVSSLSYDRDSFNPVVYSSTNLGAWLQDASNGEKPLPSFLTAMRTFVSCGGGLCF